jgi:hypothetical protein
MLRSQAVNRLIGRVHGLFLLRTSPYNLPPFALWPALPTADYYGGSVLTSRARSTPKSQPIRDRPAAVREFLCSEGQPVNPVGGSLYPWVLRRRATMRASPRHRRSDASRPVQPAGPNHAPSPPWPDNGAATYLTEASDTSFVASPWGSAVARPARASAHPDSSGCSALTRSVLDRADRAAAPLPRCSSHGVAPPSECRSSISWPRGL